MDPASPVPPSDADAEADALRIQTASLAAQQMALHLEEEKLRQRSAALERQESQLAAHLDERRARLLELQEQVRKDREALKAEKSAVELERRNQAEVLAKERGTAESATRAAEQERKRLVVLRKRLWQRWRRQNQARQNALAQSEREAAAQRSNLERDAEVLQRERNLFLDNQKRANGEIEMGRRLLQEGWEELALRQQEWDACLNNELLVHEGRRSEIEGREAAITQAGESLATQERHWTRKKADLVLEIEGLENRVANLRAQIPAPQAADDMWLPIQFRPAELAKVARPEPVAPEQIEKILLELADQRRHLLEQWQKLVAVQAMWESERVALLADLEKTAERLHERERYLGDRAALVAMQSRSLQSGQQALERDRIALELRQSRLATEQSALESARDDLEKVRQAHADAFARAISRIEGLRGEWNVRRQKEIADLQLICKRYDDARSAYVQLRNDLQTRQADLMTQQRDLEARTLAYQSMRQELINRAADANASERKLVKLEQRNRARMESERRELTEAEKAVKAEITRLDQDWKRLRDAEIEFHSQRVTFGKLREAWEQVRAEAEAAGDSRSAEVVQLEARHARDAQEIAALREEVERIARLLIGEAHDTTDARKAA
jgi:hypothetical protein